MRWFVVVALALSSGCSKKGSDGLPPASEWSQNSAGQMQQTGPNAIPPPAPPPGMMGGNGGMNPHARNDPHAGLGIDPPGNDPSDPHAGLGIDPNDPSDPHAGMNIGGGSPDVTKLGLPAPDPNRKIDGSRYVKGVIKLHMKAKDRAKAGTSIFVVVKRADSAGQPTGTPLAVDKLTWNNADLPFELTEAQAMVGGTELTGEVIVTVRYDQDSDALSKEAGDIVGQTRVTLPAENVQIWLDTIL